MPLREKLRKVFHRDGDEDDLSNASNSTPSSPARTSHQGDATRNSLPRTAQRPVSTGDSLPGTPVRSQNIPTNGQSRLSTSDRQNVPTSNVPTSNVRRSEDVMANGRAVGNARSNRYSEDVADWNIIKSTKPDDQSAVPAPLQLNKDISDPIDHDFMQTGLQQNAAQSNATSTHTRVPSGTPSLPANRNRSGSISRKAVASPPRAAPPVPPMPVHQLERKNSSPALRERASLDEASRVAPTSTELPAKDFAASEHIKKYAVKDSREAPSLAGVVDLSSTVDTTVDEKWAPAVVHEKVDKEVHHIREERITREIHYHDVYHRILPIIDIEVLPTRHFIRHGSAGGLVEISESEIPSHVGGKYKQNWAIVETVSKDEVVRGPRRFTAREFKGTEGDYKEYISDKGVPTTETTWVHPPTIATYGQENGMTFPFHFGSPDPRDDGLRYTTTAVPIVGSSRKHHDAIQSVATEMGNLSLNGSATMPKARNTGLHYGQSGVPTSSRTTAREEFEDVDPRLARE